MSEIVQEGEKAPDFTLKSDCYDEVTLSKQNKKNVILYFYPKDNTPGCTQQAIDFTDKFDDFVSNDTIIFGVSKDDPQTHEHFKSIKKLKVTLLSDEDADIITKYGAWVEKNMYGKKYMGIERSTFLIDKEGVIRKIWRKVRVKGHIHEVLEEVKKINS